MIELGVEPKRKSVVIAEDEPAHYLILGDFGGRATEPLAIDRDNFDAVMPKLQVNLAGASFRELDDFHPDNLYRNLNLFREFDAAPRAEQAKTDAPKADIGELLRPPACWNKSPRAAIRLSGTCGSWLAPTLRRRKRPIRNARLRSANVCGGCYIIRVSRLWKLRGAGSTS